MKNKIIKIINKLPIIDELKDVLIKNIDVIDKEQLISILDKYSQNKVNLFNEMDNKNKKIKKEIYSLDMIVSNDNDRKDLTQLLNDLDKIYN